MADTIYIYFYNLYSRPGEATRRKNNRIPASRQVGFRNRPDVARAHWLPCQAGYLPIHSGERHGPARVCPISKRGRTRPSATAFCVLRSTADPAARADEARNKPAERVVSAA